MTKDADYRRGSALFGGLWTCEQSWRAAGPRPKQLLGKTLVGHNCEAVLTPEGHSGSVLLVAQLRDCTITLLSSSLHADRSMEGGHKDSISHQDQRTNQRQTQPVVVYVTGNPKIGN